MHAHRKLTLLISSEKNPNPYLGMMSILIESAAPLAVFGIGTAVTVALPPSPHVAKVGMVFQIPYKIFMVRFALICRSHDRNAHRILDAVTSAHHLQGSDGVVMGR